MPFELRDLNTDRLIRTYANEGSALAFVRDVARIAGREEAARFALFADANGTRHLVAGGETLVRQALEDRTL